jgi:hypothetical protein
MLLTQLPGKLRPKCPTPVSRWWEQTDGMDGLAAPCGVFGKDEDTRSGLRARLPFWCAIVLSFAPRCTSGCLIIDHCPFPIGWSLHVQEATCNAIPHDARGARDRAKAPSIRGNLIYWLFRLLAATITGLARFSYVLLFWASPTYECNEFARKIGCQRKKEQ